MGSAIYNRFAGENVLDDIKHIYDTVRTCVKSRCGLTDFFQCCQCLKQGCVMSPILFSLFINVLANEIIANARHDRSLGPTGI